MVRRGMMFAGSGALLTVLLSLVLVIPSLSIGVHAAAAYANPAFQQQWQQGEAITPNFWGPLANAHDGQQEPYKEAQGGQRLVQYFDKGRMELTNGKVTNGLLASEIIKGQIQTGDDTFQPLASPNIAIAGDDSNPAPTYAGLAGKAGALLQNATSAPGAAVTNVIGADGSLTTGAASSDPAMMIGAFDDATKHNVAATFVDYRNKAGLATIGLAISEPFRSNVKVGGQAKDVMVQVFERRVLTYTASNDPAFKVEMGNIGQHYYKWRYANGAPVATTAPAASATAAPAAATTAPAPTSGDIDVIAIADPATPKPDTPVNLTVKLLQGGKPLANTAFHVDWNFEQGVAAKANDGKTNGDGIGNVTQTMDGAIPGTTAQIIVTVNGKAYNAAGLAIT